MSLRRDVSGICLDFQHSLYPRLHVDLVLHVSLFCGVVTHMVTGGLVRPKHLLTSRADIAGLDGAMDPVLVVGSLPLDSGWVQALTAGLRAAEAVGCHPCGRDIPCAGIPMDILAGLSGVDGKLGLSCRR